MNVPAMRKELLYVGYTKKELRGMSAKDVQEAYKEVEALEKKLKRRENNG